MSEQVQVGTKYAQVFGMLAEEFGPREVRQRPQGGRSLSYVTARTVMNRLDLVLGPENWWDKYTPTQHGVICELSISLPGGEVITKADVGGNAGMADEGDDEKSGFSDAFKRAAVKFGVGRHLYGDGFVNFGDGTLEPPDSSPAPARREPQQQAPRPQQAARPASSGGGKTAKDLWELASALGQEALDAVNEWGKQHGYGKTKWREWPPEALQSAYEHIDR